jgi:Tfp pilus assembly protein PilV
MIKTYRGTSIIEIVIAAALISMSVIAALSLSNHSQKQNTYARDLAEASKYTTEVADWLRTQRSELGWATMAAKVEEDNISGDSIYCLNSLPSTLTATDFTTLAATTCDDTDFIPGTIFQREIFIDPSGIVSGILKATIVVDWIEKEERHASLEVELTQW